jgi:hypothetical protein
VHDGEDAIIKSPRRPVPGTWLRDAICVISVIRGPSKIGVHSWLADPPKSKNNVDTFHRIPVKGQFTPGTSEGKTKENSVETRRAFQQKPPLSPSSTS